MAIGVGDHDQRKDHNSAPMLATDSNQGKPEEDIRGCIDL
jgi:hypothetical protein